MYLHCILLRTSNNGKEQGVGWCVRNDDSATAHYNAFQKIYKIMVLKLLAFPLIQLTLSVPRHDSYNRVPYTQNRIQLFWRNGITIIA